LAAGLFVNKSVVAAIVLEQVVNVPVDLHEGIYVDALLPVCRELWSLAPNVVELVFQKIPRLLTPKRLNSKKRKDEVSERPPTDGLHLISVKGRRSVSAKYTAVSCIQVAE
jgi:hypothetical protein